MDPFTLVGMSWGQLRVQSWFHHEPVRSRKIIPNVVCTLFFKILNKKYQGMGAWVIVK